MQQLTLALAALVILAGCDDQNMKATSQIRTTNNCDDSGIAPSFVKYGDSHLSAKAVQNIKKKTKWRIKLQADKDYADAIVTIIGKTADSKWINTWGKASDSPEIFICVPDGLSIGKEYYYSVSVQGVGFVDPRAKVVN